VTISADPSRRATEQSSIGFQPVSIRAISDDFQISAVSPICVQSPGLKPRAPESYRRFGCGAKTSQTALNLAHGRRSDSQQSNNKEYDGTQSNFPQDVP